MPHFRPHYLRPLRQYACSPDALLVASPSKQDADTSFRCCCLCSLWPCFPPCSCSSPYSTSAPRRCLPLLPSLLLSLRRRVRSSRLPRSHTHCLPFSNTRAAPRRADCARPSCRRAVAHQGCATQPAHWNPPFGESATSSSVPASSFASTSLHSSK